MLTGQCVNRAMRHRRPVFQIRQLCAIPQKNKVQNHSNNNRKKKAQFSHRSSRTPSYSPIYLKPATKQNLYQLHKKDQEEWSVPKLAAKFQLKESRVSAIIRLKDFEKDAIAAGRFNTSIEKLVDEKVGRTATSAADSVMDEMTSKFPKFLSINEDEDEEEVKRSLGLIKDTKAEITGRKKEAKPVLTQHDISKWKYVFTDISR
jgi:hypothetical protein